MRDEGAKFAEKLAAAGTRASVVEYDGVHHFFMVSSTTAPQFGLRLDKGLAAIKEMLRQLHEAYSRAT